LGLVFFDKLVTVILQLQGNVQQGRRDFEQRLRQFADVFRAATGELLHRGTVNVKVQDPVEIREDFRIDDPLDGEQILQFEVCRANG
jgi:hypothetical protein